MLKCISQGDEIDLALSFALLCRALGIRAKVVRCFRLESGRPYEAPRCVHNVGTCSTVVVMFCASFCEKKKDSVRWTDVPVTFKQNALL